MINNLLEDMSCYWFFPKQYAILWYLPSPTLRALSLNDWMQAFVLRRSNFLDSCYELSKKNWVNLVTVGLIDHKISMDLWRSCLWSSFFGVSSVLKQNHSFGSCVLPFLFLGLKRWASDLVSFARWKRLGSQLQLQHQGWIRSQPFVQVDLA